MAVYLDDWRQRAVIRGREDRWSHLVADDRDELQAFASALGVPPRAFQDHAWRWHYDVPETVREQVLAHGAHAVGWRDVGSMLRARRRSMLDPPPPVDRVEIVGGDEVRSARVGRVLAMRLHATFVGPDAPPPTSADADARPSRRVVTIGAFAGTASAIEIVHPTRFALDDVDRMPIGDTIERIVNALRET